MELIENYFRKKSIEIWEKTRWSIEGVKGPMYINIKVDEGGYLVIISIRDTPKMVFKQLKQLDEAEVDRMWAEVENMMVPISERLSTGPDFYQYYEQYNPGSAFGHLR